MRRRRFLLVGLASALLGIALSTTPGHRGRLAMAETSPPTHGDRARDGTIHLNFRNVDILQMITLMSELTGRNFLVDDKVRGRMTLIAPQPVTRVEAYQIFLSALAMQGFTVVSQGPISKILPLRDAKTSPLPTVLDTVRPRQ